jgi:hypothetical protein
VQVLKRKTGTAQHVQPFGQIGLRCNVQGFDAGGQLRGNPRLECHGGNGSIEFQDQIILFMRACQLRHVLPAILVVLQWPRKLQGVWCRRTISSSCHARRFTPWRLKSWQSGHD